MRPQLTAPLKGKNKNFLIGSTLGLTCFKALVIEFPN
jgi:hypothetical protein